MLSLLRRIWLAWFEFKYGKVPVNQAKQMAEFCKECSDDNPYMSRYYEKLRREYSTYAAWKVLNTNNRQ